VFNLPFAFSKATAPAGFPVWSLSRFAFPFLILLLPFVSDPLSGYLSRFCGISGFLSFPVFQPFKASFSFPHNSDSFFFPLDFPGFGV